MNIHLNEEVLKKEYKVTNAKSQNVVHDFFHYLSKYYRPNKTNCSRFLRELFPLIDWLPKYKFKEYFLSDLISGVTLGIVLVPQTMGYSLNGVLYII